uniref:Uncharacterized protein n=1 Tax=Aegilops tauschii subsp. strangulata TaxID=200361 RepID=A0A453FNK0_AEGTS
VPSKIRPTLPLGGFRSPTSPNLAAPYNPRPTSTRVRVRSSNHEVINQCSPAVAIPDFISWQPG